MGSQLEETECFKSTRFEIECCKITRFDRKCEKISYQESEASDSPLLPCTGHRRHCRGYHCEKAPKSGAHRCHSGPLLQMWEDWVLQEKAKVIKI